MGRQEQIIEQRLKKIKAMRAAGINPYPNRFDVKNTAKELQDKYKSLKNNEAKKDKLKLAGRLMSFRNFGKIAFGVLQDHSGKIQIQIQSDKTPEETQKFLKDFVDTGDIIGVEGTPIRTERGELSVLINKVEMLTKSLLPLPEKWHGLQDEEERYRKRYLDMIMNPEVNDVFVKRAKIIDMIRAFLKEREFVEVEIPTLQTIYGGASAEPFETHLNALDIDLFLSISPELHLKRLVVGGLSRVFTICKNFRNEGIDRQHNPEFTMLEFYQAYGNYEEQMEMTEDLLTGIVKELHGKTKIAYQGKTLDFKKPLKRIAFRDLIKQETGIDLKKANTFEKLKEEITKKNLNEVDISEASHYGALLDELYKRTVRPSIIQPTFLTHYPVEMIALAKRNEEDPTIINTFQLLIDGAEIIKAYDELNDPLDQEARLKEQQELLGEGHDDAMPMDEDFVNALKVGLPPTAGYGMGIDRLTMLLTNTPSIRDVIAFPFMRPLGTKDSQKKKGGES
jgi:lysyl-tRNA synthetase class 2